MAKHLELRAAFRDGLRARNLPRDQQRQGVLALDDLIGYLADKPVERWSEGDLNAFLTERIPALSATHRRDYNTAIIIVHELLARTISEGLTLTLETRAGDFDGSFATLTPRTSLEAEAAALALLDEFEDPDDLELPPLRGISSVETPRLDPTALKLSDPFSSPRPKPQPAASPDRLDPLAPPGVEVGSLDLLDPLEPPDDNAVFDLLDHPDVGGGLDLLDPLEPPTGADDDSFDLLAPPDDGFDLLGEPLEPGGSPPPREHGFDRRELSMLVTRDEEDGAGLKPADVAPFAPPRAEVAQPAPPTPPVSVSRRAPRGALPEAWRCERPHVVWTDGRLLVDSRYVVDISNIDDPETLTPPASQTLDPAWKMGLFQHRFLAIGVLVLIALSALLIGLVPALGALVLVLALVVAAGFGWLIARIGATGVNGTADSAEDAVKRYIGAVRVGLYPYARALLAWPSNGQTVNLQELRKARAEPIGSRFNTAGPAALGVYWEGHVDAFDDDEASALAARAQRFQDPVGVPLTLLVENAERGIALFAARARGRNRYAVIPAVSIGGHWFLGDGEMWLRDGYVEMIAHYGERYAQDEIDASGLLELCKRGNITRADVEAACEAGRLTEGAASVLTSGLD